MPSQTKKKDTVTRNLETRYDPFQMPRSFSMDRNRPNVIRMDMSGSMNYRREPIIMARFHQPPDSPSQQLYSGPSITNSNNTSTAQAAQPNQLIKQVQLVQPFSINATQFNRSAASTQQNGNNFISGPTQFQQNPVVQSSYQAPAITNANEDDSEMDWSSAD
ncbi:hypothetical protein L3Y34_013441 [Caenorhabditis briggsae]|uniref:Uncharacterized protein n=1 Tax=Caenorhabditis briggsae TaxID=6238 RepID=A0AAE9CXW2_CAEBR|nr:hypothetical protein L3Y34_013441 [Caenorhabditis briggsae]